MMMMLLDSSMRGLCVCVFSFCARLNDKLHQILTFFNIYLYAFLCLRRQQSILNPIHRKVGLIYHCNVLFFGITHHTAYGVQVSSLSNAPFKTKQKVFEKFFFWLIYD